MAGAAGLARSEIVSVAFFWVHTDHLGTPLAVTDTPANPANAKVVWRATYEAFGKATVDEDPDGDQVPVSLNVRFPGQYHDAESGLHYNMFRTYDPNTGRYLEVDLIQPPRLLRASDVAELVIPESELGDLVLDALLPYRIQWAGFVDPQSGRMSELGSVPAAIASQSRYAYAGDDPANWIDPLGDSKKEGITRGADRYLARLRAVEGNKTAICKIENEAKALFKAGSKTMSKRRYENVRAWAKLARRKELTSLIPAACSFSSLCACAEQPDSCAAMFED